MNRRTFLRYGATAAGTVALGPGTARTIVRAAAAIPANDRIGLGLIGTGLMGSGHVHRMLGDPGVQVLAVCDVDASRRETALALAHQKYGAQQTSGTWRGCVAHNDFREVLARPDIDAVLIATPDHWHTPISVAAANAGKDVYCEKPVSMTIDEGCRLAAAMRHHDRVFQTGTQYRSIPTIRHVVQFIRDGGLGRIKSVFTILDPLAGFLRGARFKPYAQFVPADDYTKVYTAATFALPAEPAPAGLDWPLWVGPAPWHDYHPLYHINPSPGVVPWSFCDEFGVASLTWHLSHSTDVIQYALGTERTGPVDILPPQEGAFPTMTCRYANGTLLHFVDHWGQVKDRYQAVPADARLAGLFGGVFVGETGWITTLSTGGPVEGGPDNLWARIKLPTREVNIGQNNHHANWLDCIRTRQAPSSDAEIGHRSASVGHLAYVAYRLGRSLRWDPKKEEFLGDPQANRLRSRALREPWRL
jgi:hypothetical protein